MWVATDTIVLEFDEVDFNIVDDEHPDEVSVPISEKSTLQINNRPIPQNMQPPTRPLSRSYSAGNPPRPPQTPGQMAPRPGYQNNSNQAGQRPQHPLQQTTNQDRPQGGNASSSSGTGSGSGSGPHQTPPQAAGQNAGPPPESVGFFSARAVKQFSGPKEDEEAKLPTAPLGAQAFNPHAESPSIRKTPGIDHTKSKPLARNGQHVAPSQQKEADVVSINLGTAAAPGAGRGASSGNAGGGFGPVTAKQQGPIPAQRGSVVNPSLSQARRIGAPPGPGSPMANRGQYRPPTIKRPLPNEGNGGVARPALAEVSVNGTETTTAAPGGGAAVGGDPKRQKMG